MSDFNPYHVWLGIPPDEQPPNHYRLLGIDAFTDRADVITNAADQRMAHVRTFATGRRAKLSQKILNEISTARVCLLDPERRLEYDERLKQQSAGDNELATTPAVAPRVVTQVPPPPPPTPDVVAEASVTATATPLIRRSSGGAVTTTYRRRRSKSGLFSLLASFAAVAIIMVLGAVYWFSQHGAALETGLDKAPNLSGNNEKDSASPKGEPRDTTETPSEANVDERQEDLPPEDRESETIVANDGEPDAPMDLPDPRKIPFLLQNAHKAFASGDLAVGTEFLRQYLGGNPQEPLAGEARGLLDQVDLATSDRRVRKFLDRKLKRLTDSELREVAAGRKRLKLNADVVFSYPAVEQAFRELVGQHVGAAFRERLDPNSQTAPNDNDFEKSPPAPVSASPSDLLTSKGLSRIGNRWIVNEEAQLEDELQEIRDMLRKFQDATGSLSPKQAENIAKLRKQIEEDQRKLSGISSSKIRAVYELRLKQMRRQLDQAERQINASKAAAEIILVRINRAQATIDAGKAKYARLAADSQVAAAIKESGSVLSTPAELNRMQEKLAAMRKRTQFD